MSDETVRVIKGVAETVRVIKGVAAPYITQHIYKCLFLCLMRLSA